MSGALPAGAYALGLTLLPGVGPVTLRQLLLGGDPERAWEDVRAGRSRRPVRPSLGGGPRPQVRAEWDGAARTMDLPALWARTQQAQIGVTWCGCPDYPAALEDDPARPAVLFWRGALASLSAPCVALVGTRHATAVGRDLAFELGRDLAAAGVCVVSGLALGIDGASHRGAVSTGRPGATVGVAASGVDRAYPLRHEALWEEVVGLGAVISETPPGRAAQKWRFPARNRIIAGLVSVVVVIESHAAGGSLITAEAALERGVQVGAVPGPVRSPTSAGTNQLLYDGAGPIRDATDVLIALGSAVATGPRPQTPRQEPLQPVQPTRPVTGAAWPETGTDGLLDVVGWQPRSLNWIVARSGQDLTGVAAELETLAAAGAVSEERGWWQRLR